MEFNLPPPRIQKEQLARNWKVYFLLAVLGGVGGYWLARHGLILVLSSDRGVSGLWTFLLIPPLWFLAVGIHEFGHLVGGWLIGGRFLMWVVGPIKVIRTPEGLSLGWNCSVNLTGGLSGCLPLDHHQLTPPKFILMVLGGPLSSAILAILLWVLANAISAGTDPSKHGNADWAAILRLGSILSGAILVATGIPATVGGFKTDGRRIWDLLRGGRRSIQEMALMSLTTQGLAGVRPAHWDPELVQRSLSLKDNSLFDIYAHLNAYYHAADRQSWDVARAHLDHLIAHEAQLVPMIQDTARCEYAWMVAVLSGNAIVSKAWLDSAGKLDFDPATRLRAEAAVLLVEGRKSDAVTKVHEGLAALETRSMSPVRSPFAADELQRLLTAASSS